MPDSFHRREQDFETLSVLKEEQEFKIKVIAAKLFAVWAANEMNLSKDENAVYCQKIIDLAINNHDQEIIINKIHEDLTAKEISSSHSKLEHILAEKLEEAIIHLQKAANVKHDEASATINKSEEKTIPPKRDISHTSYVERIENEREKNTQNLKSSLKL